MHLDVERIDPAGFQIAGFRHRLALGAVDSCARDLCNRAIRRHVREAGKPVGQRGRGRGSQQSVGTAKDREFFL